VVRVPKRVVLLALVAASAVPAAGETPGAREQLRLCTSLSGEAAIGPCERALALGLTPAHARTALAALARRLASVERWDAVVETYRRLVALAPEDPEWRLRLGRALLLGQDEPEAALAALDACLTLAPLAEAHGWRGFALNALGRFSESVEAFEATSRLDPSFFDSRPAAAQALEASRRGVRWPPETGLEMR